MSPSRRAFLRYTGGLGASVFLTGCLGQTPTPDEQVREVKPSLEQLGHIETALASGYRSTVSHIGYGDWPSADTGGLGEVFLDTRQGLAVEPTAVSPDRPQLLFARLTETGRYEITGVGWSVPADAATEPPELFGRAFHGPVPGYVPGQGDHYGLHVWLFDSDPAELFGETHPALAGPSFVEELEAVRDAIAPVLTGARAEEDGYTNTEEHISYADGLYGVPFVDPDAPGLSLDRPRILLYRMTDQWYYELLGVEWYLTPEETTVNPSLLGQDFHALLPGHSPHADQPNHYGLHAWIARANPAGMFALYNPALT